MDDDRWEEAERGKPDSRQGRERSFDPHLRQLVRPAGHTDSRRARGGTSAAGGDRTRTSHPMSGRRGPPWQAASRKARRPVLSPTRFSSSPTFKVVDTLRQSWRAGNRKRSDRFVLPHEWSPGRGERRCRGASANTIIGWISATLAGVGPSGGRCPPLPFVAANTTLTGSGRPSVDFLSPPFLLVARLALSGVTRLRDEVL